MANSSSQQLEADKTHFAVHHRHTLQHRNMPFEAPGPVVTKKRARMVALMYPKAGLSFEEIDRYWGEEHARIFSSIDIVKKNLIKYEQVGPRLTAVHIGACH